jgi:hypothetical protein
MVDVRRAPFPVYGRTVGEVYPRQCPCLGLSNHGESMDAGGFDGFRHKQEHTGVYPGSPPRRVKTYILLV